MQIVLLRCRGFYPSKNPAGFSIVLFGHRALFPEMNGNRVPAPLALGRICDQVPLRPQPSAQGGRMPPIPWIQTDRRLPSAGLE